MIENNENETEDEKEILLNIMYTGSYLQNNNIGHEAINLFKDDNGNSYIYVLPFGTMDQKHNGKIKTILLIRRHNAKTFEIIAKAEVTKDSQVAVVTTTRNSDKNNLIEGQREYINKNDIRYGEVRVNDIFSDNNGKDEQFVYVTFSTPKVTKVKNPIYLVADSEPEISHKDNFKILTGISKFTLHQTMYISNKKNTAAYEVLNEIIQNDDYWGQETPTLAGYQESRDVTLDAYNIIDIIRKNHDELCYSNLLAYFFDKKHKFFQKFAKDMLGIEDFSDEFEVSREWKNIDILVDDYRNKNVIVIENKIKSGINGIITQNNNTQAMDKNTKESQLTKYYNLIKEDSKYKDYKKQKFFIFTPDYNQINIADYGCEKIYIQKKYSEIFKFFKESSEEFKDIAYFKEFLFALQKHIQPVDNSNEEEMFKRFLAKIKAKSAIYKDK